jgi:hypothetical protein
MQRTCGSGPFNARTLKRLQLLQCLIGIAFLAQDHKIVGVGHDTTLWCFPGVPDKAILWKHIL